MVLDFDNVPPFPGIEAAGDILQTSDASTSVPGMKQTLNLIGNLLQTLCIAAPLLVSSLSPAWADEESDALTLHYFGTIGLARATSEHIQYVSDLSQPNGSSAGNWSAKPDSVLGMQANYAFSDQTEVVTQIVSRYRYNGTYRPEVMWAYAHFTAENGTEFRVGRLGTDFYMLADSRLIGYTNLTISPSLDFFGQLPLFHIDGADLSKTIQAGNGLLTGKVFAGYTGEKVPFGDANWNLGDSPMLGANIDYHQDDWSYRLGYAQMRMKHDWPVSDQLTALGFPAVIVEELSMNNKTSRYYSAGLIYDHGPIQLQWMANKVVQESLGYQNYYSSYVLAGYSMGNLTPFAGVSRSYTPSKQLNLGPDNPFQAGVDHVLDISHTNQTTWTMGMRWNFRRNMDVKAQLDCIRGKSDSTFLFRGNTLGWNGSTDVFSLAMDFAF